MQIGLKNTYFTQNLRIGAGTAFKQVSLEDKDEAITKAMGILERIKDCFSDGAQRKALGHLFDMVQAEKANRDTHLSFDEKLNNRSKAVLAFRELADLAVPNCEFVMAADASHQLVFRIADSVKSDCSLKLPFHFEYFDTEQAVSCWNLIKDGFRPDDCPKAIEALNSLVNENNTCGKVRNFTELTRLARPEHQTKFSIEVASSFDQADLSFSFKDQLLYKDLSCPRSQVEDVTVSLMHYKGRVKAGREDPGFDHSIARMFLAVGKMEGNCFDAENRSEAAKIFFGMFVAGVTDADIERYCDQLVKLDARFKGCRFIFNKKQGSLSETEQMQATRAATKIQHRVRIFLATGTKETPSATVNAVKVNGRVEGYIIPQDGTQKWVRFPAPIPPKSTPAFGTSKVLTHKNDDYVGLTIRDPYKVDGGYVIDPSKADKRFVTFNENIAAFLDINNLDCIVQQFRVNEKQFISKNLGPDDLLKLGLSGKFPFHAFQWARLADQLDMVHAANMVHRDIKPGNMALYDGHVRLFDNETFYEMATPEERAARLKKDGVNVTTPCYLHPALRRGKYNEAEGLKYGVIVDQYSFINSMISTSMGGRLRKDGVFCSGDIVRFLQHRMQCNNTRKLEIWKFLLDPLAHRLPRTLAEYFERD